MKWKDNKVVNMMSIDAGVEPLASVKRYDKDAKEKVDVSIANAWLVYKRDVTRINEKPMSLKNFRLSISRYCRMHRKSRVFSHPTRRSNNTPSMPTPSTSATQESVGKMVLPTRGLRSPEAIRTDTSTLHAPVFTTIRQTCKNYSTKKNIHNIHSCKWMCNLCNVALSF